MMQEQLGGERSVVFVLSCRKNGILMYQLYVYP